MLFQVALLRFQFRALDKIHFPPGMASNIFRGAFGLLLRRIASHESVYNQIFEPRAEAGPSGLRDQPRPFVFRAAALNGCTFEPGESFELEVVNFDLSLPLLDHFRLAFLQLREEGIGPGRARVELIGAEQLATIDLPLFESSENRERLRIVFLTPTEFKSAGRTVHEPSFEVLVSRARDRIGSLCSQYQGGPPPFDFAGLGLRAREVRMASSSLREERVERKSSRTGMRHQIGGFIGQAEYSGELGEFLPILRAAEWTGVGRMTVWGNGQIKVIEGS